MPIEYDADYIVIGSGFGGSVAALRLAQRGYRVAVLEKGRRFARDAFATSSWDARNFLWEPAAGLRGILRMDPLRHATVLSGVGVGGGSLAYGNTLFRPLPSFFSHPRIRALGGEPELGPYYDLAARMMGVVPNPRLTPMDELARETAAEYGREHTFTPSPVGVFFGAPGQEVEDPYFAGEGPPRTGCTSCGGCFIGCRVGAKNTLMENYLYLAERLGCEIRAETQVVRIVPMDAAGVATPDASGEHGFALETRRSFGWRRPVTTLRARSVFVAAGVLGTARLLLRARASGDMGRLSDRLGRAVRTNSETLLAVRARGDADHSRGIAASSSVFPDEHTQVQVDRQPAGSDSMTWLSTLLTDGGSGPRVLRWIGRALRHPLDFARSLWPVGFAKQTAFLVVMQDHDSVLRLRLGRSPLTLLRRDLVSEPDGDGPLPAWIPLGHDFARRLARRVGGAALSSTAEVFLGAPMTAHVLGGCEIASCADEGVVDDQHRAFGYENLYITDGSVVPANLGVNPALSILAMSERALAFVPVAAGETFRHLAVDVDGETEARLVR